MDPQSRVLEQLKRGKPLVAETTTNTDSKRAWVAVYRLHEYYSTPGADLTKELLVRRIEIEAELVRKHWEDNLDLDYSNCSEVSEVLISIQELSSTLAQWSLTSDQLVPVWKSEYPF